MVGAERGRIRAGESGPVGRPGQRGGGTRMAEVGQIYHHCPQPGWGGGSSLAISDLVQI